MGMVAPRILILICLAVCGIAQNGSRRSLTHRDYDGWRTIQRPTLSRDGRYLAYGLFPQAGDGEFVVLDLKSGTERRETAGALPPPPEPSAESEPGENSQSTDIRISFTHDSRFVVFTTFPARADTDAARKARKELPKGGLGMLDLRASTPAYRVSGVKSYQVPEKGGGAVAWLREPAAPVAAPAKPASAVEPLAVRTQTETAREEQKAAQKSEQPQTQTATPPAPAKETAATPRRRTPEYGSDLVVRDLASRAEHTYKDTLEYSLTKDGKTLIYAVASRDEGSNGIYALDLTQEMAPRALLAGKGKYIKLTWDAKQTRLAFLSNHDGASVSPPAHKLYLWQRGSSRTAEEIVSAAIPGFRKGFAVSERGQIAFSRDGSRLFFGAGPPVSEPGQDGSPGEEAVVADLWHYKDAYIQPMQKVRATQDRNRSYRGVWHIAERKFVQLADDSLAAISASDDGRFAIGTDDRSYRSMVDYDRLYLDYYLIHTATGERKRLLEKGEAGTGGTAPVYWSPDGSRAAFYRDRNWHAITVADGRITNLTARLPIYFYNEQDDRPSMPGTYGAAGWTRDSKLFLLYDQYDIWAFPADGSQPRNLTDGVGRREKIQFRVVRLERESDEEPRGLDRSKPLLLRAENTETRDSGFWRDRLDGEAPPQELVMGARNYRTLAKAEDADVVVMTASTFSEYPDLQITDTSFAGSRKVTNANPQQAGLRWGSGELVSFHNADGVPLQAALYKPQDFDPAKKYPMLVYIYERLSQGVHNFVDPRPGTSINISYYVSNGYLVLTPDIVYTAGNPGASAMKCVLPAIEAALAKGGVDESAIGIAGHSWGGYQAAYLVTQTKRFRAAEAGAPVGNMTSAYNGIRWGSGLPRQFQYERAQSRIGGSLWDMPLQFLTNSPVFHVRNVETPVLIIHNDQDDAVPWYQGIELYLSLRRNGKEAYLFNYNGEKHGLRKRSNQKDWTVRMQQYFDHHLKGAAKPAWMEKGIPFLEREEEKRRFLLSDTQ